MPRASKVTALGKRAFPSALKRDIKKPCAYFGIQVLGGAILVREAFLPGAERKGEDDEEEASENKNGPR